MHAGERGSSKLPNRGVPYWVPGTSYIYQAENLFGLPREFATAEFSRFGGTKELAKSLLKENTGVMIEMVSSACGF